jgi:thioredoxin 1|uniref:Thioredoxin n=1 Tax=Desulfobacca acetoxidans TaxID=60893 RepID=A0A7C5AKG7_9BACT
MTVWRLLIVLCLVVNWSATGWIQPLLADSAAPLKGKPAVYEFGAKTCVPCIQMQQVMAELKASHGDRVEFRMVYVDENRDLFLRYRIMLIPTQVFLNAQGEEVDRHVGALTKEELLRKLKDLRLID